MHKKILSIISLAITVLLLSVSCQEDPAFPDPGFEAGERKVTVRRDTADYYDLQAKMKIYNGVQKIEIINALTYDVLDEVDAYNGKKKFDFTYRIDLTPFEKDTVLNYLVKVTDKDSRSFNQSFRITVRPFSFPEIKLVGGNSISVAAPVYTVKGLVSTGMKPLKSIHVNYEGAEQYAYFPADDDTVIYDMPLKKMILLGNMDLGRPYLIDIIIEDEDGQVFNTTVSLYKTTKIKKPDYIIYKKYNGSINILDFHYDENDEKIIRLDYLFPNGNTYQTLFKYNELGMVDTLIYRSPDSLDFTSYEDWYYFEYIPGTKELSQIVHQGAGLNANNEIRPTGNKTVKMGNFVYTNGVATSFRRGNSNVPDVRYSDPFNMGERIFGEFWQDNRFITNRQRRQYITEYDPVLMPTFMEGFPPFAVEQNARMNIFEVLCWNKYIMLKTKSDYTYSGFYLPSYSYTTDEEGNITQIQKTFTGGGWLYEGESEFYTFIY